MTTAWQHLRLVSPLSDGHSAWQHLTAIEIGSSNGQIIFCSQRTVVFEQDETTVIRKPKRIGAPAQPDIRPAAVADTQQNRITAIFTQPKLTVTFSGPDEITITNRRKRTGV